MYKRSDIDILLDILESINRITEYCYNLDYETFLKDKKTQDAVIRNIEIIGEAVKLLSPDLRKKYRNIPWKNIAGMRDKLIHFYFGVNLDIVWDVSKNEIPKFKIVVENIISELKNV